MSPPVRIALVGAGDIFSHHAKAVLDLPELFTVSCVCDPDTVRAAAGSEFVGGCPIFPSLTEALASSSVEFDAVDLMIPHHIHEKVALEAFTAHKHTLLEKPLSTSLESCRRLVAAAKESGVVFAVGENAQYIPDVLKAKELINTGAIGDVYFVRANFWESTMTSGFANGFAQGWRNDILKAGGGNTIDGGTHWVRALRLWMGEIDRVVAINERPLKAMAGESLTHAIIRFASGKSGSYDCLVTDAALSKQPFFQIQGSKGEIVLEGSFDGGLQVFTAEHPEGKFVESDPSGKKERGFVHSYRPQLEDFGRAVCDGTPLAASAEYAVGEVAVINAMYRSGERQAWEDVWGGDDGRGQKRKTCSG